MLSGDRLLCGDYNKKANPRMAERLNDRNRSYKRHNAFIVMLCHYYERIETVDKVEL